MQKTGVLRLLHLEGASRMKRFSLRSNKSKKGIFRCPSLKQQNARGFGSSRNQILAGVRFKEGPTG